MKTFRLLADELFAGLFICGWLLAFWVIDSLFGVEEAPAPTSEVDRLLNSVWEAA